MWITTTDLPTAASHRFYSRLNQLLRVHGFDDFAEARCATFYTETMGRPGVPPGVYFRLLLIGYFEGIDSERGVAWRAADSLALRDFVGFGLDQAPPDHSPISRMRRLIDLETHRAVFTWVLQCLSTAGLVKGKTKGRDLVGLYRNPPEHASDGTTPLLVAAQAENTPSRRGLTQTEREQRAVDALKAAIALGADIDEATDEGNTALHIAASKRLNAVVGFLARAGAALNLKNNNGHTPLAIANMKPEAPKGIAVVYSRPVDDRSTAELLRQLGATE